MAQKTFTASGSFRPFDCLEGLAKKSGNGALKASGKRRRGQRRRSLDPNPKPLETVRADGGSDEDLFRAAMAGVTPMDRGNCVEPGGRPAGAPARVQDDASKTLDRLRNLVDHGEGFVVAQTPEYMEGLAGDAAPEMTRRLHRGDFAIQAHIDLHGLCVPEAQCAFDDFLRAAIAEGKRGLLVVHGRGLSSPSKPVLKAKVRQWLTRGPWRKWVLAFTSARLVDGGAGATYVLLRRRPRTRTGRGRLTPTAPKGR